MTCNPRHRALSAETVHSSTPSSDFGPFLRSWLANPLRIAAIAPSGRALGRIMTAGITPEHGPVLELGPGTGVFTRALLARGIAEADLTLVELEADFARLLRRRFPQARIVQGSAAELSAQDLFPGRKAGAAISGLGLVSMPVGTVRAILAGTFHCLRPDGAFYQFTYGPACPVPRAVLQSLGLRATRIGGTWANLPPASVYRILRDETTSPISCRKGQP